jgi:transposase
MQSMSEEIEIAGIRVPKADWDATPASIKAVVVVLSERLSAIEEQLKQNSQNSSRPPSSDGFKKTKASKSQNEGEQRRKIACRESNPGEKGPKLYPIERCHVPQSCQHCGERLKGRDEAPKRHQILEIPVIVPQVVEHQLHQLECACCGNKTRALLPPEVTTTGYGDRLAAVIGWLSGEHRQSHRMVQSLLKTLVGVEISRGSINRIRQQVSEAIAQPVEQAHRHVQGQGVIHSDETSFAQGNGDGQNADGSQGWLWVLVTPWVMVFSVVLSRSQATAKRLIGEAFKGILISDRYSAYSWVEQSVRQVCWAHLKRDFTAMAQRSGASQEIGEAFLARERRLFHWWHRVRDGTLTREQFVAAVEHLRAGFKAELEAAASLPIGQHEKSPLAKTVRTARELLKVETALWTFVYHDGVDPTNNAAERALRSAVIWRRNSFGSQSRAGSEFVARILTVVTSLKAQQRNPVDYLAEACCAHRLGLEAPSLVPEHLQTSPEIPVAA